MTNTQNTSQRVDYGHRLIPTLVDDYARTNPDYVFAQIPKTADFADGLDNITISTFARAVNEVAHRIDSVLGRSTKFDTIAYLGPTDLRYFVIAIAASKVGYKTLLPSPRNSIEGLLFVLEATSCRILASAPETKVDHILEKRTLQHHVIKTFDDWLATESVANYPYNKTFEEAAHDPFIVIHTSGSTGLPKPVTLCHGGLATVDAQHLMPPLDGYRAQIAVQGAHGPETIFCALPPFHMAGILGALTIPLYYLQTIVWPPAGRPISTDVVENLLDNVKVDACFLAPSVLEELGQSPSSLEKLRGLDYVEFGGGPLAKPAGDTVSQYTTIRNVMGSSEATVLPIFDKEPEDWMYFHFDPRMKGVEFREVDSGLYEQILVRHSSTDPYHSTWYTFPDEPEYKPKDLFSKHPSKPDLWFYEGRSDDVLVFSNGEKFNPSATEATLRAHPDVDRVLVIGQARFEPAALIQLKSKTMLSDHAKREVLDTFAPYLAKANETAPGYAKLRADHLLFTTPEKPMKLADKGTIKRAATIKAYEQEVDQLYADAESFSTSSAAIPLDARDLNALTERLQEMLVATLGLGDLAPDQDIFAAGMDSLQVINLVKQLKSSLKSQEGGVASQSISPKIVYSNPTATQLGVALHKLNHGLGDVSGDSDNERIKAMEDMLAKYSKGPSESTTRGDEVTEDALTIVLTGSTGSLGSYLLDALLASGKVAKVICLNRGAHGEGKQKRVNASRGLVCEWRDKVQFLTTDLSKPRLGLSPQDYNLLIENCSSIIHNQWQVDFNLSLESFEPHIAGVRALIDLSSQSTRKPPIFFTSSISTLGNWPTKYPGEKVPERAFHDFTIPSAMGYAESKYVAELLLEDAVNARGISAAICRVGQLAGPVSKGGMWSKQEWLPSLVASSKYLGKVPTTLPSQDTVPWVPVDTAASIIADLVLSDRSNSADAPAISSWLKHYNIVNPNAGSWSSLIPSITKYFSSTGASKAIEPVSFQNWIEALQASAAQAEDVRRNPGIKILEFYEGMNASVEEPELATDETLAGSESMRGLTAVGPEWMETWLRQWAF